MLRFDGHTKPVRCVAFAPDGSGLASGGDDRTVRVWDRATAACLRVFTGHAGPVWAVAFHPDGTDLASGGVEPPGETEPVHYWHLADDKDDSLPARLWGWADRVRHIRPTLAWWDGTDGDLIHCLRYVRGGRGLLTASRHANAAAAGYAPSRVRCLEVGDDAPAGKSWLDHRANVRAAAVSADAETVAVASRQYVRCGRLDADRVPPAYPAKGDVWSLALSPDGHRLAGCWQDRVTVWDAGGTEVREYAGHDAAVRAVAYHPGGSAVASAGLDGRVMVWDPDTGTALARYDWGLGPVHALAFAPDGLTLAVAGDGGLILVDFD